MHVPLSTSLPLALGLTFDLRSFLCHAQSAEGVICRTGGSDVVKFKARLTAAHATGLESVGLSIFLGIVDQIAEVAIVLIA